MPSPELRCLECNRQFADLTADQEVERCAECGKFVVATPTLLKHADSGSSEPIAELVADGDIPTVSRAKPKDELPLAQPVKPAVTPAMTNMPAWARRSDEVASAPAKPMDTVRPVFPPHAATVSQPRSYTELPSQTAEKKQKIGVALFVAFLFLLGMVAAVGVLGYTIIRGLQMKKVITEATPAVQPFNRVSES